MVGDSIGALLKGLRVLECFGGDRPRLSIAEASALTGYDRAMARRCLLTLVEGGYATHDGKFFTLTARALRLGTGALAGMALPQVVQPWLDRLSEEVGHSASAAVLDGAEIVYVARAAQRRVMSIGLMPGSRLPAHCTSLGRVLLAALPEAQAREVVLASDLRPRTPLSLSAPEAILDRLRAAREEGYAAIDQEVEIGLRSIAVPLQNRRGVVVAAMNLGMPAVQDLPDMVATYLPRMQAVAEGVRAVLP
jgi:IclR family transcriptional regulator, pca regulon regulatory protein